MECGQIAVNDINIVCYHIITTNYCNEDSMLIVVLLLQHIRNKLSKVGIFYLYRNVLLCYSHKFFRNSVKLHICWYSNKKNSSITMTFKEGRQVANVVKSTHVLHRKKEHPRSYNSLALSVIFVDCTNFVLYAAFRQQ